MCCSYDEKIWNTTYHLQFLSICDDYEAKNLYITPHKLLEHIQHHAHVCPYMYVVMILPFLPSLTVARILEERSGGFLKFNKIASSAKYDGYDQVIMKIHWDAMK